MPDPNDPDAQLRAAMLADQQHEASRQANGALVGASTVTPDNAALAISTAPTTGVPPSIAQHSPDVAGQIAQERQNAAIVATSAPVRGFLANGDSSQVAVVQDDLDNLKKIGDHPFWRALAAPAVYDVSNFLRGAAGTLQQQGAFNFALNPVAGVLGAASAGATNTLTTPAAQILATGEGIFSPRRESYEQSVQDWQNYLGLVLLAFGPEEAVRVPDMEGAIGAGARPATPPYEPPPEPPLPAGAVRHPTGPDGLVQDEAGLPRNFESPGDAARWILKEGYGQPTDQILNLSANDDGSYGVRVDGYGTVGSSRFGTPPEGVDAVADDLRAKQATTDVALVDDLQNRIAASATADRSPETIDAFLDQAGMAKDATVEVDPHALVKVALENPDDLPKQITDMSTQIVGALRDGDNVEMPLSTYLTATSGKSFAAELNKSVIFRPGGTSVEASALPPPGDVKFLPAPGGEGEGEAPELQPEAGGAGKEPPLQPPAPPESDKMSEPEKARYAQLAQTYTVGVNDLFKSQYLSPIIEEAKAIGMTKAQLTRLSRDLEKTVVRARGRAVERAREQILKERSAPFRAAATDHAARLAGEINDLPVVRAMRQLSQKGYKLDKDSTFDFFPGNAKRLPANILKTNGNHPDVVADQFGYASGAEMVRDLGDLHEAVGASGAKNLNEFVKMQAREAGKAAAATQLGYDITPEALMAEANGMVPHTEIESLLIEEWKALGQKSGIPLNLGKVREGAQEGFRQIPVKTAIDLPKMENAVFRNGRIAFGAAQKKDWIAAFQAKQLQFTKRIQLLEAFKFRDFHAAAMRTFSHLARIETDPTMDQAYLDLIHRELRDRQIGHQEGSSYNYDQWLHLETERRAAEGEPPVETPTYQPLPHTALDEFTTDQFRAFADRITNLVKLGQDLKEVTVEHERMQLEAAVSEALAGAVRVARRAPNLRVSGEEVDHLGRFDMMMAHVENMIDVLDDQNPNGIFNRLLMRGARNAVAEGGTALKPELDATKEAQAGLTHRDWHRLNTQVESGHGLLDPTNDRMELQLIHSDLIGIYLNASTEFGRWRLEEGGWGFPREKWTQVLADHMLPADRALAEKIKAAIKGAPDKIMASEDKIIGSAPELKNFGSWTLPRGRYNNDEQEIEGGYFPVKTDDGRASALKGAVKMTPEELYDHYAIEARTAPGYDNKVTGARGPTALDWRLTLNRSFRDQMRRIGYTAYIRDASKFLHHPAITRLVNEVHGPYALHQFDAWLKRQIGYTPWDPRGTAGMDVLVRQARLRTYKAMMTLAVGPLTEHATSVLQTAALVGVRPVVAGYARGLLMTITDPGSLGRFVDESSGYMRERSSQTNRELRDIALDATRHQRALPWNLGPVDKALDFLGVPERFIDKFSAAVFQWINHSVVAKPQWIGAYYEALEGNARLLPGRAKRLPTMTHDEAVAYADKVIGRTHGSALELDMSSFQSSTNPELLKLFSMFQQFRGTIVGLARGGLRGMFYARDAQEFGNGLWMLVMSTLGVLAVARLVTDDWPKASPFGMLAWAADSMMMGLAHLEPFGEESYDAMKDIATGKPVDFELSPITNTISYAWKGLESDIKAIQKMAKNRRYRWPKNSIEDNGALLAMVLSQPIGQLGKDAQVLADMRQRGKVTRPIPALLFGPGHERPRR